MKLYTYLSGITCLLLAILFVSCSSTPVYDSVYPTLVDGKYDSEFPYRNSSEQLENVSNSIRLINTIAFYTSYVFSANSNFTKTVLLNSDFKDKADQEVYFNRTASGTATIIDVNQGDVSLLTVAHVVCFPDTIISYFLNPDGSSSNFVQSISVKTRQTNYVPDLPENGEFEIIVSDKTLDIALLGHHFRIDQSLNIAQFKYPWGNSSELEWGSFVYVFGFPMNYKMITKGIVSLPPKDKNTFLIDAVFNRGSSGGIVLGVRDGVPNFELVGLVRSVPAEFEYTLRPFSRENDLEYNPMLPYKGEVYVDKEQVLRTGIVKVIGIEAVRDFLIRNEDVIRKKGYRFKSLFVNPPKLETPEQKELR